MSIPDHTDPLTDRPREPDALRRLNLEQDSRGGSMWPWIIGVISVIFVVTLVYGYKGPIANTASTPPTSSLSKTTGVAPATPKVNPLAATPTPAPTVPPADTAH